MFFILLYGWDGLGWQRFLYDPTVNNGVLWSIGKFMGFDFIRSNVGLTLLGMGVFIIPFMIIPMAKWVVEGTSLDNSIPKEKLPQNKFMLAIFILIAILVISLSSAGIAAIITYYVNAFISMQYISIFIGILIFIVISYLALFRESMPVYRILKKIFVL